MEVERDLRAWLVLAAIVAWAGAARAAESAVAFNYSADAACPSAAAFSAQVRARSPQVDLVERRGALARFSVLVRIEGKGAIGRLDMRASDGTTTSREVRGDSCEGVVTALALVTALSASTQMRPSDAPGTADSGAALVYRSAPTSSEAVDQPPPPSPSRADDGPSWRPGFGGAVGVLGGVAPEPVPVAAAIIDLRREPTSVPLNFRLHAALTLPETQTYPWGTVEVRVLKAGLEACPVSWSPVPRLELLPCAGFEAGPLMVQGRVNERGGTSSQATWWWADVTATARAEWLVGSALHLELEGGALMPLTRNTYVIDNPETSIYSAPPASFALMAGAMMQFP
jgi:hypothetical protein